MGPDVRASRPMTTCFRFPVCAHVPNAAAQRATISGVRSVPTRPRTPDTLTISVSDMRRLGPASFHGAGRQAQGLELRRGDRQGGALLKRAEEGIHHLGVEL